MADKGKTILILGNGFDLAHGLPTKYSDFLEFCKRVDLMSSFGDNNSQHTINKFKEKWISTWETRDYLKDAILEEFCKRKIERKDEGQLEITYNRRELSEIQNLLVDNIWYEYFKTLYDTHCMKGENWIDFESEIRFIIKKVDETSLSLTDLWEEVINKAIGSPEEPKLKIFKEKLKLDKYKQSKQWVIDHKITIRDFREKSFEDLERLTRALELYLGAFVEKIPISEKIPELLSLTPDYVINFNYTDTYERIYNKGKVYHIVCPEC